MREMILHPSRESSLVRRHPAHRLVDSWSGLQPVLSREFVEAHVVLLWRVVADVNGSQWKDIIVRQFRAYFGRWPTFEESLLMVAWLKSERDRRPPCLHAPGVNRRIRLPATVPTLEHSPSSPAPARDG